MGLQPAVEPSPPVTAPPGSTGSTGPTGDLADTSGGGKAREAVRDTPMAGLSSDGVGPGEHPLDQPLWNPLVVFRLLTFGWFSPLLRLGAKRPVTPDDFMPLPYHDTTTVMSAKVARTWFGMGKSRPADQGTADSAPGPSSSRRSLITVCGQTFWVMLLAVAAMQLIEIGVQVTQAVLLGHIVDFIGQDDPEARNGYLLALGFSLCSVVHGFLHQQAFFYANRTAERCRVASINMIYKKVLRLSKRSLAQVSTGHVVNLITNDVERFKGAVPYVHYIYLGPIHAAVITYLAWREVGVAAFPGLAVLLILVPFNFWSSRRFSQLRHETSQITDRRVKTTSEVLGGMRVIKMYGWEAPFSSHVEELRKQESAKVSESQRIRSLNLAYYFCATQLTALATFGTYFYLGNDLTPEVVFTTLALFNTAQVSMALFFPAAVQGFSELRVTARRMEAFLNLPELEPRVVAAQGHAHSIELRSFTCSWTGGKPALVDITASIPKGTLCGVVGPVGAGKSTLLTAILGEMEASEGAIDVYGRLSYCPQEAWILSLTVRENILYGQPYDAARYAQVVDACCLAPDFRGFPAGDATAVGERGVTLSGGQKARLSLARAMYREADVYLLDDPLSAVDATVGREIFRALRHSRLVAGKTIVLCTHQVQYLPEADTVMVLAEGRLVSFGGYAESKLDRLDLEGPGHDGAAGGTAGSPGRKKNPRVRKDSGGSDKGKADPGEDAADDGVAGSGPYAEERREEGVVSWGAYSRYLSVGNTACQSAGVIFLLLFPQVLQIVTDWFLARWSEQGPEEQDDVSNITVYSSLTAVFVVFAFARSLSFMAALLRSSRKIHDDMFSAIMHTSLHFFDSNPLGRIVNRFSKDVGFADDLLPWTALDFLQLGIRIAGSALFIMGVNPWVFLLLAPIFFVFIRLRRYFLKTSREIKRWEAVSRSPVYSFFSASLAGLSSIRSFASQGMSIRAMEQLQNSHMKALFNFLVASRWLGYRLDALAGVFATVTVFGAVAAQSTLDPGVVGLSLVYALRLTGAFQWAVRQSAEVENQMVSIERIFAFCSLEPEEAKAEQAGPSRPRTVPAAALAPSSASRFQGMVEAKNLTLHYFGPPVLKGLSFSINPGQKIGVVGRTGAGKSSLISAIFRLYPTDGYLGIDGVDTKTLGLHALRSRVSVIPQDPLLFSGSMRCNLDPFGDFSDEALWAALDQVELGSPMRHLEGGLDFRLQERGDNFSVGQRQLICLARAILRRNGILVLDEATANIDNDTDELIQRTIRENFHDCTVITVAHRLHTVMDSDKILVMDAGRAVEFEAPYTLLQDEQSVFASLVRSTGSATFAALLDIAREHHHAPKLRHALV